MAGVRRRGSSGALLLIVGAWIGFLPALRSSWSSSSPPNGNPERDAPDLGFLAPTVTARLRGGGGIATFGGSSTGSLAASSSTTSFKWATAAVGAAVLVSGLASSAAAAVVATVRGGVRPERVVACEARVPDEDLADFKVGESVSGRVAKIRKTGPRRRVFVDIDIPTAALLHRTTTSALLQTAMTREADDDDTPEYVEGMELEGLRISQLGAKIYGNNPRFKIEQALCVSQDRLAIDYNRGDEVSGKVIDVMPKYLLIAVPGLSRNAVAPPQYLAKESPREYRAGDDFNAKVLRIDAAKNTLILAEGLQCELATDYRRGDAVSGKVVGVRSKSLLVEVPGLPRDAVAPQQHLERESLQDYHTGDEFSATVFRIDSKKNILILAEKPPKRRRRMMRKFTPADIANMVNEEVEGQVVSAKHYGLLVDIGMGPKKDGVVFSAYLPDGKAPTDYTPREKVRCWVMPDKRPNKAQLNVLLSLVPLPEVLNSSVHGASLAASGGGEGGDVDEESARLQEAQLGDGVGGEDADVEEPPAREAAVARAKAAPRQGRGAEKAPKQGKDESNIASLMDSLRKS